MHFLLLVASVGVSKNKSGKGKMHYTGTKMGNRTILFCTSKNACERPDRNREERE